MDDFFAELNDDLATGGRPAADPAKLARLQMANGGSAPTHQCPACKGRGNFYSYTGRLVGNCFKCAGSGKVSTGKLAAHKGRETQKRNAAEWLHAHHAEIAYMGHRAQHSSFYAGLQEQFNAGGKLSERQIEMIRKDMAEAPARIAAAKAKREADRTGDCDLTQIEKLFDTARSNGLKKLKFRTPDADIKPAPDHGVNAGWLYVTKGELYLGKLKAGKFVASRDAPEGTLAKLQELAKDPLAVGIAYGKQTGNCCCCGRELSDPVSVERGIGPICETKWGM